MQSNSTVKYFQYITETIKLLKKFLKKYGGYPVPCTPQEVNKLESMLPNSYKLPAAYKEGVDYERMIDYFGFLSYRKIENTAAIFGLDSYSYLEKLSGWKAKEVGDEIRFFPPSNVVE